MRTFFDGRSGFRRRSPLALAFLLICFASPALAADLKAGRYQVVLGDCEGCHAKNLAGGVALQTPFGRMLTPNITPDKETGIGNYTLEAFRLAMRRGVAPGGKRLYPAMPYPAYAHMNDRDIADLWAYLRTVKPVKKAVDVNQLQFPFNQRVLMRGWNMLFFKPKPIANNPAKSAAWNRGAYLVNGPAHCSACHTAKNAFGADKKAALTGASLQGWFAPDLTSDPHTGLGTWRVAEIVEYLQTGRTDRSIASGPMAEAVENSTAKMTDGDLGAIAVYLKDLPPSRGNGGKATGVEAQMKAGAILYDVSCAACHGRDGKGSVIFPALAGNTNVTQIRVDTVVRMVLAGGKGVATPKAPTGPGMPSFDWRLNNEQTAAILTYIRNNWGNQAPAVSSETVGRLRQSLRSGS